MTACDARRMSPSRTDGAPYSAAGVPRSEGIGGSATVELFRSPIHPRPFDRPLLPCLHRQNVGDCWKLSADVSIGIE
jgi:hypothetical protein